MTPGMRPSAGIRLERWSGDRQYLAASAGAELRAWEDRFELTTSAEHAAALRAHAPYASGTVRAAWASARGLSRAAWTVRIGFDWVGNQAPIGAWAVAGSDVSRDVPLRAHTSVRGGRLAGGRIGRKVMSAGVAGDYPVYRTGPLVFSAGLFLDGARIGAAANGAPDRSWLDGGGGLRIGLGDGRSGVLRIDLARSLATDRAAALTVAVQRSWPILGPDRR
jgi:hypothetical protein